MKANQHPTWNPQLPERFDWNLLSSADVKKVAKDLVGQVELELDRNSIVRLIGLRHALEVIALDADIDLPEIIHNPQELAEEVGADSPELVPKAIYKGTSCGASVEISDKEVSISSIVEGVEECTEIHTLEFPFTDREWWAAVDAVEKEAGNIWRKTHGCPDCWDEPQFDEVGNEVEFPGWPINPECKSCEGQGAIV